MDIKSCIINKARETGLDLIGFASCSPFSEILDVLNDREAKGYLSGFEEKNVQKRINPGLLVDNCQSIISAGISYNVKGHADDEGKNCKFKCSMSMSTWGEDYHNVLGSKLKVISEFIETELCGSTRVFVDTGPVVEREAARRAGIGFIGKNCSLINPSYGSFIFIGEILTDLYIEPDTPLKESCGDCSLCIKACPTGALCAPYTVDAKKCLSYVTQSKNIHPDYYSRIGSCLYGCDICQAVCPRNREAAQPGNPAFIPEKWNIYPDPIDILNMDNRTYRDTFKMTSSGWRGRKILQRNAVIALGNSRDKDAAPYIIKTLSDSRSEIRETSVYALYNLMGKDSSPVLKAHLQNESDEQIQKIIREILDKIQ